MADPSADQVLLELLEDIFSTPCISVSSDSSASTEYRTTALLLQSARSAPLSQLVELILHLLLSHPPFTHTAADLLVSHQQRFLAVWARDHEISSHLSVKDALTPATCLNMLRTQRLEFQRLGQVGFRFISELLLSCLQRLSPEGSSKSLNIRSWVHAHGEAVVVLEELLYSVPPADWLRLDSHAEHALAMWKCLKLLCSGAAWWSMESAVYRANLERLAKCVFCMPIATSLFRAALRVDIAPGDIHTTVTTLINPLEQRLGVQQNDKINAFTPTPFAFPTIAALDRHDFTKGYEFSNLRVMFVSWVNSKRAHRELEDFKRPWAIEAVLQHTEAHRRLKAHPDSAVRVALAYIFNEAQQGCEGFKPSTDMKAIELLKVYISHMHVLRSTRPSPQSSRISFRELFESRPEACVILNSAWVLPWLWHRRATDLDFTMVMTSTWLVSMCGERERLTEKHKICLMIEPHSEAAFDVFHDLLKNVLTYEFIASSADKESALRQIRRLLRVVLEVAVVFARTKPYLLTQHLCMLIFRCFMDSLDQEWIPVECWSIASVVFTQVPKLSIIGALKLAQVTDSVELLVPIFLREMEAVTSHCEGSTPTTLDVDNLHGRLEILTAMIQFSNLMAKANDQICAALAKKSHLIGSAVQYVGKFHNNLFISSARPELAWTYSASIGAVISLLSTVGFGTMRSPTLSISDITNSSTREAVTANRDLEAGNMITLLLGRVFEMSYVISALCELVKIISSEWWLKRPFVYLEVWSYIRSVLLDQDIHRWCVLLPSFGTALTALTKVEAPIRELLIASRWNLTLACNFLLFLLNSPTAICPTCSLQLGPQICGILHQFLIQKPVWQKDLLEPTGLGNYSILKVEQLESKFEQALKDEDFRLADGFAKVAGCFNGWEAKGRAWQRKIEREMKVKNTTLASAGNEAWERMFIPVDGVIGVSVSA